MYWIQTDLPPKKAAETFVVISWCGGTEHIWLESSFQFVCSLALGQECIRLKLWSGLGCSAEHQESLSCGFFCPLPIRGSILEPAPALGSKRVAKLALLLSLCKQDINMIWLLLYGILMRDQAIYLFFINSSNTEKWAFSLKKKKNEFVIMVWKLERVTWKQGNCDVIVERVKYKGIYSCCQKSLEAASL